MKYCISIFALPHEIDDLELTLHQLGKAFQYVDSDNFILDVNYVIYKKNIVLNKLSHLSKL